MPKIKICLVCEKPLRGRSDKKFCNDNCRNNYNNQLRGVDNSYIRNINAVLLKNRRILENILLKSRKVTSVVSREKLNRLGFQFRYATHSYATQTGKIYFYCYDYGYLALENDCCLIVKKKE